VLVSIKTLLGRPTIGNLNHPQGYLTLLNNWSTVVGSEIDRHTTIVGLDRQTLRVVVDSATWATELSGMKNQILQKISRDVRECPVRDILFSVSQSPEESGNIMTPAGRRHKNESLSEVELDLIKKSARWIKNKNLRDLTVKVTALNYENNKRRRV